MGEFGKVEKLVVGWHDRGLIGVAETREDFITLKSGRLSPHYANFRGFMSFDKTSELSAKKQAKIRKLTIAAAAHCIQNSDIEFDHIAPLPQAVTQLGGAIAVKAGVSSLNPRVKEGEKGYGKHKPVEGDFVSGDRVLGFDDVVTTGEAKNEFLEPMTAMGLEVPGYVVLLDRQEGGKKLVEASGRQLEAVVGMYDVAEILAGHGRIASHQYEFIQEYLGTYGDLAA